MTNMYAYGFLSTFLLLFPISFLNPPNLSLIDARKLAISNGVFSVDLIHRQSKLSPYYNSSMARRARLKRAPLGTISHDQEKVNKSLGVIPADDGETYLIRFALGTPQVEQFAIADTGSSLIWVQCSPCIDQFCIPQNSSFFNPTKSSTFNVIPCGSKACNDEDFTPISCPLDQNTKNSNTTLILPCLYQISYDDHSQSIGVLATDTIGFPSIDDATSQTLPSSIFGCGFDQSPIDRTPILGQGTIGLGTGPSSLISQLSASINYKFSYCLAPPFSDVTSKLNFGADVKGPTVASTPFTTGNDDCYHLTLNGISIGIQDNPIKIDVREGLDMIIDSGTTLIYLPQSVYDVVKGALASSIKLKQVHNPNYDLCYNAQLSKGEFNPPNVVFGFKGGDVVLKAYNTFMEIDDDLICLAMTHSEEIPFVFGNIAQVNFLIGYDLQAKQVSFAPSDCANP